MKIYTIKNKVKFSSELIILFGLLDKIPKEPDHCYNLENKSRYHGLIEFCKKKITYVDSPLECDIMVLPYKFTNENDKVFKIMSNLSEKLDKPLWCFYNDDDDRQFNLPQNIILYRTSFYQSTKLKNEKPMIAFGPDYYKKNILEEPKLSIGYCGHIEHGRKKYLDLLSESLDTDFILRKGFWAPGIPKEIARIDYFNNLEKNLFTFCYRGAGNFSYRFYETLMMGRIPILIDTDCVLPFFHLHLLKKENIGIIIKEEEIVSKKINLIEEIKDYYRKYKEKFREIQLNNRKIWETYYSPIGFLTHINL